MFTLIVSSILLGIGLIFKNAADKTPGVAVSDVIYITLLSVGILLLVMGISGAIMSVFGRLRFCRKLKKMCIEKGYEYKDINSPIKSFFVVYSGEDAVLSRREKVIRLKFYPGFISKWFVHIENEKKARIYKRFFILGSNIKLGAYGVPYSGGKGKVVSGSIFEFKKKIDLSFSKDNFENVVIISPKCRDMTLVQGNSRQIVGSGSNYGKIKLYYQKDFLNYFDRM